MLVILKNANGERSQYIFIANHHQVALYSLVLCGIVLKIYVCCMSVDFYELRAKEEGPNSSKGDTLPP